MNTQDLLAALRHRLLTIPRTDPRHGPIVREINRLSARLEVQS